MTPYHKKWIQTFDNPQEKLVDIMKKNPLGNRMTTKEEIASMIVYLASEQASHISGQTIFVDDGYVHLDRTLAEK